MSKFFSALVMVLVSAFFFSCSDSSDKKAAVSSESGGIVELRGGVADPAAGFAINEVQKNRLLDILLSISSGDVEGKGMSGDSMSFKEYFEKNKDLVKACGFSEDDLRLVFASCIDRVIAGSRHLSFDAIGYEKLDYNLLELKNYKFLVESVGVNFPWRDNGKERFLKDTYHVLFDDTREMILSKL